MATTATIFYSNDQMLTNQDNPFGIRYDSSILPTGSVVVGFMRWYDGQVQELLDWTLALSTNQEQAWNDTLNKARATLRGLSVAQ